tara:strand:+ start:776 stop:1354 length:579 start_codon:yes stop_codon:yes gene_type:complete
MITFLKGKLIEKNPTDIVLDVNGVGYRINISLNTFSKIDDKENCFIYTYFHVKEDAQILYGFSNKEERSVFKLLISVSGIGPNTAQVIMSSMSPENLQRAVMTNDIESIKSVKGIGLKSAQRLILDLKDKISKISLQDSSSRINNTIKDEALSALKMLGFARKNIETVIDKTLLDSEDITVEDLIKQVLNKM